MPLTPEAKGVLLANVDLFVLYYFPDRVEVLKDFHLELLDMSVDERRGIMLFPATHGKSTLVSELVPIFLICRDPDIRIGAVFKDERTARGVVRSIQDQLLTNERLIEDFGPFKPEGDGAGRIWTQSRFDIVARSRRGASSTYAAFGAGSRSTLGYRVDKLFCDDIVTDRNSSTPEQRETFREWFMQGPMTMPDKHDGTITIVGTAFHPDDLYHDLMRINKTDGTEGKMWRSVVKRAIIDQEKQIVLWPEERPYLALLELKAGMGMLTFNQRFQNEAVDPAGMSFREEWIYGGTHKGETYPGCLDHHFKVGDRAPEWHVYTGFDPAVGTTRGHKFCAHVTLGVGACKDHERCFWMIDLRRDQMTMPQQIELIIGQHEQYQALKSLVEANVFQAALVQQLKDKINERNLTCIVEPHYTSRQNKPDPLTGVLAMQAMLEQGKLHIPWGDAASRTRMQVLVDELVQYTPEKRSDRTTDTVMALWFAWRAAQQQGARFKPYNRLTDPDRPAFRWPASRNPWGQTVRNPAYPDPVEVVLP